MSNAAISPSLRHDGTDLIQFDPWLEGYAPQLRARYAHFRKQLSTLDQTGGLLGMVSQGHLYFGFNRGAKDGQTGIWYREWAPAAQHLSLVGDFNFWDRHATPMTRDEYGVWSVFLPDAGVSKLVHNSRVKVHVVSSKGEMDRIPAYIRRVEQDPTTHEFTGVYWNPPAPYRFAAESPQLRNGLRIYEAHVGMSSEQEKVSTFDEFTRDVLPRISAGGYNAVQLMAVMEHPYYGSFGYHVSNFFAVSSRFGTPEELKRLIDFAHSMGILVLLDVVHSHSVKNTNEGLNGFDGSDHQYFHAGPRGRHEAWDSLLFNYGKFEVQRFLLSNLRYWVDEFHFDGFRFDGVTSMLYLNHGLGTSFSSYEDYFGANVDEDAVAYLQLANQLVHELKPSAITVAEDVSGMVGIARPVEEGGIGFDYRLAMGVPDFWIKLLKDRRDEDWNLTEIFHTLMNRRYGEKHIGYAESHDQALVGDKTIAFWLMDKEMYWNMAKSSKSHVVDRGIALHKIIRLITFSLAGEGYLNFMGNEFGHPEWVDFPRQGNGYSHAHARRQWSLADNGHLRYTDLLAFDAAMLQLDRTCNLLNDPFIEQLFVHEERKLLIYRRGPLVFAFNFHPTNSYSDLRIPVPDPQDYRPILNTDDPRFGGPGLCDPNVTYYKQDVPYAGRQQSVQIYLPVRTAQVLSPM